MDINIEDIVGADVISLWFNVDSPYLDRYIDNDEVGIGDYTTREWRRDKCRDVHMVVFEEKISVLLENVSLLRRSETFCRWLFLRKGYRFNKTNSLGISLPHHPLILEYLIHRDPLQWYHNWVDNIVPINQYTFERNRYYM